MAVPILDVSHFFRESTDVKSKFANQFTESLRAYGVARLAGTCVSPSGIAGLFDWIDKYFELPLHLRRKHVNVKGPPDSRNPSRGYRALDDEKVWKLSPKTAGFTSAKELRESFDMGPLTDASFPTPWPDESDLPGFRQYMESQYEVFQKLALQLMGAIELGLKVPEGEMIKRCAPDGSELRLNYYPAVTSRGLDIENSRRIWPHTDTGLFSFVFQGSEKGLQVEDRKNPGTFVRVPQDNPDEIIVNVANTLERWTNGNLPACLHQVAAMEDLRAQRIPPRRSIVFFFRAAGDKSAGPLPQFVSDLQPARYQEMAVSEYNQSRNVLQYS